MRMYWFLAGLLFWAPSAMYAKPPERIILLTPNLTEIFFAFNQKDQIIGVSEFSDYPPEALSIARVGSYNQPNMEKIVSLRPDLVVALNEGFDQVTQSFRRSSIPLKILTGRTLRDYETMIQQIGAILEKPQRAQVLLQEWKTNLEKMNALLKGKVLIQIDHNPIIGAGQQTFLSEILEKCGLENIIVLKGYPRIPPEFFYKNKPDYILLIGRLADEPTKTKLVQYWQDMALTKTSRVISVSDNVFSRLVPRLAPSALRLCLDMNALGSKL